MFLALRVKADLLGSNEELLLIHPVLVAQHRSAGKRKQQQTDQGNT